ncbi:MAG: TIR domain-containing protein [Actinomycetia bacterium]|nr:TIR domain-containing protein [Actinomycetes bacterium]
MQSPPDRFDAFISYSQKADHELAAALQDGLEKLAKQWNERRALRVFRDTSVMGVSPSLWLNLTQALDRSAWLIILASPPARESKWVNEEIRYWLDTKGPGASSRILLVQTSGELVWNDAKGEFDAELSTALPTAITPGCFEEQPRTLDMRWYGEIEASAHAEELDLIHGRFRSCVAEIAAPIHGKAKDELDSEAVRLERRARRTRNAALVVLSLLATAALISATVAVVNANRTTRALREAEARQFLLLAEAAPTEVEAVTLAQAALDRAVEAEVERGPFASGLFRSVSRGDLPLTTYAGLAQPDSSSGGRRGLAFSDDGTTFGFIGTEGAIHVIRSWDLAETHTIPLADIGTEGLAAGPFTQLAFADRGRQLAVVSSERMALLTLEEGWTLAAEGEVDFGRLRAADTLGAELPGAPLAAVLSPDLSTLGILDDRMVLNVVNVDSGEVTQQLGDAHMVADADLVRLTISADQNRLCASGGGRVRYAQVSPPELIADIAMASSGLESCWAEGCAGRLDNLLARTTESQSAAGARLVCVDRSGAPVADYRDGADLAITHLPPPDLSGIDLASGRRLPTIGSDVTFTETVLSIPESSMSMAAQVLPHATGPILVDHDSDGVVSVRRLDRGTLPPIDALEDNPSLEEGSPVLSPDPQAPAPIAFVDEYAEGDTVRIASATDVSADAVRLPKLGDVVLVDAISATEVVVVFANGSTHIVDLATSTATEVEGIDGSVAVHSVAVRGNRLIRGVGGRFEVFDINGAGPADLLFRLDSTADNTCLANLSADGRTAVVVTCNPAGAGQVSVYDVGSGNAVQPWIDLPFDSPHHASVTADGSTYAVASRSGEVAVGQDGSWMQPPSLLQSSADHNSFRLGWVELDPSGRFMVTRRDAQGLALWPLPFDGDRPLGLLTERYLEFHPTRTVFGANQLTLAWAPKGRLEFLRMSWPLGVDALNRVVCSRLPATPTAADAGCERTLPPPSAETLAGPKVALNSVSQLEDVTRLPVPDGLSLRHLDIAPSGTIWAAGNGGIVRMEPSGALGHFPANELSPKGIVALPDGGALVAEWFDLSLFDSGGKVGSWEVPGFPHVVARGEGRTFFLVNGGGLDAAGTSMYYIDDQASRELIALPEWSGEVVDDMIYSGQRDALVVATRDEDDTGRILVHPVDGDGFGEPFELAGAVNVWSLAEDTSGSLWYLAQSRSQLGRIDGDGAMTVFDLPPSFNAIALTARLSRDGVLVAGTTGLLAVGDEVGPVWNVPGAIAIRDLVVSLDGTVWAADTTANAVFKIELRDAP